MLPKLRWSAVLLSFLLFAGCCNTLHATDVELINNDLQDLESTLQQLTNKHKLATDKAQDPVNKLTSQFRAALQQQQKQAQEHGILKIVIAAQEAIDALDQGKLQKHSATPAISKLKDIYFRELQVAKAKESALRGRANNEYVAALRSLVKELTIAGRIEEAVRLKEKIDDILVTSDTPTNDKPTKKKLTKPKNDTSDSNINGELSRLLNLSYHCQAANLIKQMISSGELPPEDITRANELIERELSSHVEACLSFGVHPLAENAMAAYLKGSRIGTDPKNLDRFNTSLLKLKRKGPPLIWKASEGHLSGEQTWSDHGQGTTISELQVGNCGNVRKGGWDKADVSVSEGTYIEGGILRASHGKLKLLGTKDRPIILRGVRIQCDYTASVIANNTIFIDCQFIKSGSWHWNAGFSSKWNFENCLLARSNFRMLNKLGYGIRIINTTFFQCSLPQRILTFDPKADATKAYIRKWNQLIDCNYLECRLSPSFIWGNQNGVYINCTTEGTSKFASATDLEIKLGAIPASFLDDLANSATAEGKGAVTYKNDISPKNRMATPYWRYLPSYNTSH